MPTDLQASSSSTSSSVCKQSLLDDSYGFDKSNKLESSLSNELMLTNLNGTFNSYYCCTPIGLKCKYYDDGKKRNHGDICKVNCSNYLCDQSGWIHNNCLKIWEQKIKSDAMKLNPQLRHRSFNPWIEILQSLLPKSFLCPCNQGTLRKYDNNFGSGHINAVGQNNSNIKKAVPVAHLPVSQTRSNFSGTSGHRKNSLENNLPNSYMKFRSRTLSANQMMINFSRDGCVLSPTEFSSQKKELVALKSQPQPCQKVKNGVIIHKNKTQNRQRHHSATYHGSNSVFKEESTSFVQPNYNLAGNIFRQRNDFKNFQRLPFSKQNAYFIQMEDDSCTGNDDTKVFLLSHLSQLGLNTVSCLICASQLAVYDHLPLIDGTFFLSPLCHSAAYSIPIPASSNPPGTLVSNNSSSGTCGSQPTEKYLSVVCINCMHEIVICCQFCHRPWTGAQLLIGSLYTYDIFAAVPCCINRLLCNNCNQICIDVTNKSNNNNTTNNCDSANNKSINFSLSSMLSNFSQLSRLIECDNCHSKDYHFVKPFAECFKPIGCYA